MGRSGVLLTARGDRGGAGFRIRAARPGDIAALQALEVDAGRRFAAIGLRSIAEDEPFSRDELAAYLAAGAAWVAVPAAAIADADIHADADVDADEAPPLGYAVAGEVDGQGHLDQVSVGVEHGGRGVGRALVEVVCAWAAAQGFDAVTLTTFRDVAWNGPLYARWGFDVLAEDELGPELAERRRAEREGGLDVSPRVAMRRPLGPKRREPGP